MAFECFWRDPGESWRFCILEFCHCFAEFFPSDEIIKLLQGATLGDLVKEGGIGGAVGVVYSIDMGGED